MGRYPDWVQEALVMTVDIFSRVVRETNLEKTKVMVCTPVFISGKIREAAYKWISAGEGLMFWERKRTGVSF